MVVDPCFPATAGSVSHIYEAAGRYIVRLLVTDAAGRSGESATAVRVR